MDAASPQIASLDPPVIAAGSEPVTVTIAGDGFAADATILVDGAERAPVGASTTQLGLELGYRELLAPALHRIQVINPGAASNVVGLEVVLPNGVPSITALVPDQVIVGTADQTVVIEGVALAPDATVQWAGAERAATRLDDNHLQIVAAAADLAALGMFPITVTNPAPGGGVSAPRTFTVRNIADPAGVLERVSLTETGAQLATASTAGALSADGRFVAFAAGDDNIVAGDTNGRFDIFVRDTCRGATACTPSTTSASVKPDGTFAKTPQLFGFVASSDLRFVAFIGTAEQVPGLPVGAVAVRDTCIGATGCTPATFQGSPGGARDFEFAISENGRFVAFVTLAKLDPADVNNDLDVYVFDTCHGASGCTPTSTLVSTNPSGNGGNGQSHAPSISGDGRFISFETIASDLVAGDTNAALDVYVRDTCIGASGCTPATVRASVDDNGAGGAFDSTFSSIDRSGRYVGFLTRNALSASDTDGTFPDIYIRDTCTGAVGCTPRSIPSSNVTIANVRGNRWLSSGARYVAFQNALNTARVVVRDTCVGITGCTPTEHVVSDPIGGTADQPADATIILSPDGRFVTFTSSATNLVAGDTNTRADVFLSASGF